LGRAIAVYYPTKLFHNIFALLVKPKQSISSGGDREQLKDNLRNVAPQPQLYLQLWMIFQLAQNITHTLPNTARTDRAPNAFGPVEHNRSATSFLYQQHDAVKKLASRSTAIVPEIVF